jgi:two-component system, NarL family, invasion response regulator UvrY
MKNVTMAIIDDHKMVREMWRALFSGSAGIEIVGEAGKLEEVVDLVRDRRPDLVLLDINLAEKSGFDAVPLIRKYSPMSKIIAVSMHSQPAYAKKMFSLGAKGYVTKNSSKDEMYDAVAAVMNGETYVCKEIKNIIAEKTMSNESLDPIKKLSLREIEIIRLIKDGLSSRDIAGQLHISNRTVEVHRHNILKKLGIKNTPSLISYIQNTDLGL